MASGADRSRSVLAGVIVTLMVLVGLVVYSQASEPPARAAATNPPGLPSASRAPASAELGAVVTQLTTATSVTTATTANISLSSIGPSLAGSWTVDGTTDVSRDSGLYRVTATGFDESDLELIGLAGAGVTPADLKMGVEILTTTDATYLRSSGGTWQREADIDSQFTDGLGNLTGYTALVNACQPSAVVAQVDGGTTTRCTLVVTPAVAQALGLSDDAAQQLASRSDSTNIAMDVLTDAQGDLQSLRVDASVATFGLTAELRTSVAFSDWNQPAALPTPPTN